MATAPQQLPGFELFLAFAAPDFFPIVRELQWWGRPNILLSYHYFKTKDLSSLSVEHFGADPPKFFIDSGAFSAFTQGVEIPLEAYADWLRKHALVINRAANLDVIGDPAKTYENQKKLELLGLKPVPVFHLDDPETWLELYFDEGHRYICLGGMVPHSKNRARLVRWISRCFEIAAKRAPDARFHGFGMTGWDLMRAYPWASVDSSSWSWGVRHGMVILFNEKLGKFVSVHARDVKASFKVRRLIHDHGFGAHEIAVIEEWDRFKFARMSLVAFAKAERWINARQERKTS